MAITKRLDDRDLEGLPGIGPATRVQLSKIGINRISDLILFLPTFLINKTKLSDTNNIENGESCLFIGVITKVFQTKSYKPNLILTVDLGDLNIQIRFLHKIIIYSGLKVDMKVRLSGIVRIKGKITEMIHPEVEIISSKKEMENVVPYYKTKKMVSQNKIRTFIKYAFEYISSRNTSDIFSDSILGSLKIPNHIDALKFCHFPSSDNYDQSNVNFELGRQRFVIEELLAYKLLLLEAKKTYESNKSYNFNIDSSILDSFISSLPFDLTESQKKAILEIKNSFLKLHPTKRLVQGDVGSGKTIVAIIAAYYSKLSNLQTALLAPTEILADQHTITFKKMFSGLPVTVECLKNNLPSHEKSRIIASALSGKIDILIGTHSLIQENVNFLKLGLIIVDEQHKFGINQRLSLTKKSSENIYTPHELYLSATPIPRSLSLVLYEGLDYTVINESPKNRKIIKTHIINHDDRLTLYDDISKVLDKKEQVYWVCSCIDYTESIESEYVNGIYEDLSNRFATTSIGMLHGRANSKDNSKVMKKFINGEIQVLVCTTMIEVGVDVANATCIVIEDSDRFGLSQLHQLRGRVGRSDKQSFCYLVCKSNTSNYGLERLKALTLYSSGFNIAEEDLKLRGSGDYLGYKQSGANHNFKLATPEDALHNYDLVRDSMNYIDKIDEKNKNKLIKRWGKDSTDTIQL